MHQNKKNSETPQSVPEPFARCPKGVLGYLQILGSGDVGSARTEGHYLFSYSPLYLLLVYAVVRAADTLTVIAIALLRRSVHPLLVWASAATGSSCNPAPSRRRSDRHWRMPFPIRARHPANTRLFYAHFSTSAKPEVLYASYCDLVLFSTQFQNP